jgi:hypothetical protein
MLLTPCFFLSSLSFSRFNLSRFDEPTQAAVSMTESRTQRDKLKERVKNQSFLEAATKKKKRGIK